MTLSHKIVKCLAVSLALLPAWLPLHGAEQAAPAQALSAGRLALCFQEIDQATRFYQNGRADNAEIHLRALIPSCSGVPHLFHNLGTIALLQQKWDDAIHYFEKSLALDSRAAQTQQALAAVYEYQAALAYKKALNLSGPAPSLPRAIMQPSSLRNSRDLNSLHYLEHSHSTPQSPPQSTKADILSAQAQETTSESEVKFELANWWRAQREYDLNAYFDSYVPGVYPAGYTSAGQWSSYWKKWRKIRLAYLPAWSEVHYQSEPLDNYVLINLRFRHSPDMPDQLKQQLDQSSDLQQQNKAQYAHMLLVMKKTDRIWKISKEKLW